MKKVVIILVIIITAVLFFFFFARKNKNIDDKITSVVHTSDSTPDEVFVGFKKSLMSGNYELAWDCLSIDSQKKYAKDGPGNGPMFASEVFRRSMEKKLANSKNREEIASTEVSRVEIFDKKALVVIKYKSLRFKPDKPGEKPEAGDKGKGRTVPESPLDDGGKVVAKTKKFQIKTMNIQMVKESGKWRISFFSLTNRSKSDKNIKNDEKNAKPVNKVKS